VDMIKEYQVTGNLVLETNSEGLSLASANFYPILDYICNQFSIDKSRVTIVTNNAEESHPKYTIQVNGDHWISNCKPIFNYVLKEKTFEYTAGAFFGKPNWHRLVLGAWLYKDPQCLLTMHYNPQDERHRIDAGFGDINIMAPEELTAVTEFVNKCPIILDDGFLNYTIGPPMHYNIIHQYHKIFVDVVSETYVSGLSFFPTEKTLRPIIAKTPFIAMGPAGYLNNLKRMGFKTFNSWWDESYDDLSDYDRVKAIQCTMAPILKLSSSDLRELTKDMTPILEHNRLHLRKLNAESVKL